MNTKSLLSQKHQLSSTKSQVDFLEDSTLTKFSEKLIQQNLFPLTPIPLEVFQVNIGKMCNQVCKHCHVDAGPDRKEIMTRETMQLCIDAIKVSGATTVDLTGGAPEMNPDFRWFVEELSILGKKIIVRCNLTIIVANKKYNDLPEFFKKHKVEIVSSLPYFTASKTDSQRGDGVFEKSIQALGMLNSVGYSKKESGLILNLVYNPSGAFLPSDQSSLEKEFKLKLKSLYDIDFNNLFAITNLPISRFLEFLVNSGNYDNYMEKLINAYNPIAAENVMCRNTLSISWNGFIYDCDFNQMLEMKIDVEEKRQHISNFEINGINQRRIKTNQHCFGCTAGSGSSCSGNVA
ncbi:MAG: arsenosugar biosynthesis radical SAM protein ArsS [Bacteroidetes bacterium]|nr:arsenosugar biosynthesis radical SAM protein ArsS [Bacteroidota bacterium]